MILRCRQRDYNKTNIVQNYNEYHMNLKEEMQSFLECLFFISVMSYFFYRSIIPIITVVPIYPFYRNIKKKRLAERRKKELSFQFKEMLNSMVSAISAGYSLENAVVEAYGDMKELYGKNSYIVNELYLIRKGILNNQAVEKLFLALGMRSHVEDIEELAMVMVIGKQYGGNLNELIREAIWTIDEKIALEKEIYTMLQAKRYQLKLMEAIPFAIILYIEITSKNYFKDLYQSILGNGIMTVCLLIYLWSVWLGIKILKIEI